MAHQVSSRIQNRLLQALSAYRLWTLLYFFYKSYVHYGTVLKRSTFYPLLVELLFSTQIEATLLQISILLFLLRKVGVFVQRIKAEAPH